jgi:TolB-like protein/DNA-binding winged helix-turn-helix (wHTH) protein
MDSGGAVLPLAPKAFETLLYLVQNSGRLLEKDKLMEAIWSDTVVEENNLNQCISAVRRVLGERQGENRFIVTIPGRGYKFVAEVIEIESSIDPIRTTDSRVPERHLSNDKLGSEFVSKGPPLFTAYSKIDSQEPRNQRNSDVPEAMVPVSKKSKSADLFLRAGILVIIASAITAGAYYFWRASESPAADAPIKSIAVLPFKPLVAENRNEALEMGMADALITRLSGSAELVVRPLESVRRSVSSGHDPLTVGRELDTEAVLDGNIQTADQRVRISARLLRTSDGRQLWAGRFDENFTDIFAVQDSISERVAAALQTKLRPSQKKRPTENVAAYELYMKGRFHASRSTREEIDKAIDYYRQAIELDPNYALAYVGLSLAYR